MEVEDFARLCESGGLYEFLEARGSFPDRERVKKLLCRDVLFGKAHIYGRMTEAFAQAWPGLFAAIRALKQQYGHKVVAQLLQRLESQIMIDGVCRRLVLGHPELRFLTIHDAALVVTAHSETVRELIIEEFERYGVRATVRRKPLAGPRETSDDEGIPRPPDFGLTKKSQEIINFQLKAIRHDAIIKGDGKEIAEH